MKIGIAICAVVLLSGCASTDYFVADGDRAGGTVTLVCNYDIVTQCPDRPSREQLNEAARACINWGYKDAEAFGSVRRFRESEYEGRLEMTFQCIGDLEQ